MTQIGNNMTRGCSIQYRRNAVRYLKKLNARDRKRILESIESLAAEETRVKQDVKKLVHRPAFRLRVGGFRVLFDIDMNRRKILIISVRPRGKAYKE